MGVSKEVIDLTEPFLTAFTFGLTCGICCLLSNVLLHRLGRLARKHFHKHCVWNGRPKGEIIIDAEDNQEAWPRVRDGVCAICLGDLVEHTDNETDTSLLEPPCGHTLHEACLRQWLSVWQPQAQGSADKCPMCRGPAGVRECMQIRVRMHQDVPTTPHLGVQVVDFDSADNDNDDGITDVEIVSVDAGPCTLSAATPVVVVAPTKSIRNKHGPDASTSTSLRPDTSLSDRSRSGASEGGTVGSSGSVQQFFGAVPSLVGVVENDLEVSEP